MNKTRKSVIKLFCLFVFVLLFKCSENDNTAGGAGAGNPATFVIMTKELYNTKIIGKNEKLTNTPQASIEDSLSLKLNISEAYIFAKSVLIPTPRNTPSHSIPIFATSIASDYNEIIGPFTFNMLTGESNPSLSFPVATGTYDHVKIKVFENKYFYDQNQISEKFQILISGNFNYENKIRKMHIHILADTTLDVNCCTDSLITVSENDSVVFVIILDQKKWFHNINLKNEITKGNVITDEKNEFHIYDNKSHTGSQALLAQKILNNILCNRSLKRNLLCKKLIKDSE